MLLLLKFKSWLRNWLAVDNSVPKMGAEKPATIKEGAAQLIERARLGDQNALALICQVRDNAKKGVPRAVKAFNALMAYAKSHPVKQQVTFHGETDETSELLHDITVSFGEDYVSTVTDKLPHLVDKSIHKAIVTVANGPSLLPSAESNLFARVKDSLAPDDKKAFLLGYHHGVKEIDTVPRDVQCAFILGHVLGTARRIQAVRLPDVPISVFAPQTGMELGELGTWEQNYD